MSKYLEHIRSKDPHDRRQHAMQLSSGILAIVFLVWITTIGWRFSQIPAQSPNDSTNQQLANIASGASNGQATLLVATTSQYSPYGAH